MNTKHTPGPWTVETGSFYVSIRAPSRMVGDTRVIGGKPDDENLANARLIAAAPDLLEALGDAAAMLEVYATGKTNSATHGQAVSAIRDALAALAKARGEV